MRRRHLLAGLGIAGLGLRPAAGDTAASVANFGGQRIQLPGEALSPWQPGMLDIHHIATGRGNACFVQMPDGSNLLIDAGATMDTALTSTPPRPDASRRPGEWVARYAQRQMQAAGRNRIDHALISHLHPDHFGDVRVDSPRSAKGNYQLSGITDVAELLPIDRLIDRDFPNYQKVPPLLHTPFVKNYLQFLKERVRRGEAVEAARVGHADQIKQLRAASTDSTFEVRVVAANGDVWTGIDQQSQSLFPTFDSLPAADRPNENMASIGLRIRYGRFGYFCAGDLTSYTQDGALPWQDVLGRAAQAAGPVDVATADHHGMFDGLSAAVVRALRPKVWVVQAWHLAHPDMLQLERMFSTRLYPGVREVLLTNLMPSTGLMLHRLIRQVRSTEGHVVVRVQPGGQSFHTVVTGNHDESDQVLWSSAHMAATAHD